MFPIVLAVGDLERLPPERTDVWLGLSPNPGSAHWSPISLVPHLIGPLLIGPPTHWSPNTLLELIGPPSHWSPISLVPHLIGLPMQPFLFHSHYYTFINTCLVVPMIDRPLLLNRSSAVCFVLSCEHSYDFDVKGGISHI